MSQQTARPHLPNLPSTDGGAAALFFGGLLSLLLFADPDINPKAAPIVGPGRPEKQSGTRLTEDGRGPDLFWSLQSA